MSILSFVEIVEICFNFGIILITYIKNKKNSLKNTNNNNNNVDDGIETSTHNQSVLHQIEEKYKSNEDIYDSIYTHTTVIDKIGDEIRIQQPRSNINSKKMIRKDLWSSKS